MATAEHDGPSDEAGESKDPIEAGSEDALSDAEAFAQIVANYGATPVVPEMPGVAEPDPVVAHVFGDDIDEEPVWEDDDIFLPGDFVPPTPEPVGWGGWRSLAWVGALGGPALALLWTLLATITNWSAPSWLAYLLIGGFLGGFGYLVMTMPKERDDPWDDGARV